MIPNCIVWVEFLMCCKHPLTWWQYSSAHFGLHLPPQSLPYLPAVQRVHFWPKYPGRHAGIERTLSD